MYGTKMIARRILSICLLLLLAISARGQVLSDGISGRDLKHNMQFIQAISPQGDTCLVMTDDVGNFEIDPSLMDRMRGNIYLKPMLSEKYKAKLTIVNPFDSINVYRLDKGKYLSQNHIFETRYGERVISDADGTIVLDEALISAKRLSPYRDKVTGYLDSLAILASGEWVCECNGSRAHRYLNDYNGYSHHPEGCPGTIYTGKRLMPKRGETYELINKNTLAKMKDGTILINTGRGPLVDDEAVADALACGKIAAYCADVLTEEPPRADNPLLQQSNAYTTPHIAWATKEARIRLLQVAIDNVRAFLGGMPQNVV